MTRRAMRNGVVSTPQGRALPLARCLVVVALAACAAPGVARRAAGQPGEVKVAVGAELTIRQDANASTGYTWRLGTPLDTRVLTLVRSAYEPAAQPRPGAPGTQVWTFKAVAAGTTTLVFEYVRPWETGVAPARRDEVQVEAK